MSSAGSPLLEAPLDRWVRLSVVWALPWFVFVPYIPIPGTPLSADDLLPLLIAAAGAVAALRGRAPRPELVAVGLLLFAIHQLFTTLFAEGTASDLVRSAARGGGRTMVFAVLSAVVLRALGERRDVRDHLAMWVAAGAAQAIFAVVAYALRWRGPWGVGLAPRPDWSLLERAHGTFAAAEPGAGAAVSANFLSAYLMVNALVAVGLALAAPAPRQRRMFLAGAAACTLGIAVSFGRASFVGLLVGAFLIALFTRRARVVLGMLAVAAVALLTVPGLSARLSSLQSDRAALYSTGLAIADAHPTLGVGDGRYLEVMEASARNFRVSTAGVATSTPHSSVLLAAAHGGWLAGALLLALIVLTAGRNVLLALGHHADGERALLAGLAAAAVAFALHDQVNNLLYVPKTAAFFWLAGVVARAVHRTAAREAP